MYVRRLGNSPRKQLYRILRMTENKQHENAILRAYREDRTNREFTDINLIVGKQIYQCHRVVLAASSLFFRKMFFSGFKCTSSTTELVRINLLFPSVFPSIIDFLYENTICLSYANVQKILVTADYLQIDELKSVCEKYISGTIQAANVLEIWKFSKEFAVKNLTDVSESYFMSSGDKIPKECFQCLTFKEIFQLASMLHIKPSATKKACARKCMKTWFEMNSKTVEKRQLQLWSNQWLKVIENE